MGRGDGSSCLTRACLVPCCRPSRRSCTSGSAGSCGPTAAASSWTWPTCGGCATRASGQPPATPASLTTVRSSPCGSWPTWSGARVRAGTGEGGALPLCAGHGCAPVTAAHMGPHVSTRGRAYNEIPPFPRLGAHHTILCLHY